MEKTPITVDWLVDHGFKKHEGMAPAGDGRTYIYNLGKDDYISINTSPSCTGKIELKVWTKEINVFITKRANDYEKMELRCFYVEELLAALDFTENGDLKEFFEN